jgi:hypothetical protein
MASTLIIFQIPIRSLAEQGIHSTAWSSYLPAGRAPSGPLGVYREHRATKNSIAMKSSQATLQSCQAVTYIHKEGDNNNDMLRNGGSF